MYLPRHITHSTNAMPGNFVLGNNGGVQRILNAMVNRVLLCDKETLEQENAERERIMAGLSGDDAYRALGAQSPRISVQGICP